MKKLSLLIPIVTSLVILASCSGGTCQKEALAYLKDTISLQWKSPKSFHFDKPEIMRETDSTFFAKVRIYGANSYGTEICHDYLYLYRTQEKPILGPQKGGIVFNLDSNEDYDKKAIASLRNSFKKDEELRTSDPKRADTLSLVDTEIVLRVGTYLGLLQTLKKTSAPF